MDLIRLEIVLVDLSYGLAFFMLGLTMLLEAGRSSTPAQARALRFLSAFGFVHGAHEWLEMILLLTSWQVWQGLEALQTLRFVTLAGSFLLLLAFGIQLKRVIGGLERRPRKFVWGASGIWLLFSLLVLTQLPQGTDPIEWGIRSLLAVPASLLAGWVLLDQAMILGQAGSSQPEKSLKVAAGGFAFYALTQAYARPLNDVLVRLWSWPDVYVNFGLLMHLIRAGTVAVITLGVIRAVQEMEHRRQAELLEAQQARLDALEQVRLELLEREKMRRDLLQYVVLAQEEERSRIARELHDETAQILTAFSLHLAALRDTPGRTARQAELVDHIQSLCRQMSDGIYRLVHDLRPAQLDDLGLIAALRALAERERARLGLEVSLEIIGSPRRIDPLQETVLFRAAQEALTNVARHAGVQQAQLQLQFEEQRIRLQVQDEGQGFVVNREASSDSGWGLIGMRERAESVGGTFMIHSEVGKGSRIEIILPYQAHFEQQGRG